MSKRENEKAILESYKAFNNRDVDGFLDVYAEDLTLIFPSGRLGKGREAIRSWYNGMIDVFPDCKYRIERTAVKGSTVWIEVTHIGTQAKEYLGIPASNKKIEMSGVAILDFEEGKVKLAHEYFNMERIKQILSE